MNIQKFTQKSVEAINNCEKLAYDYGNQEIEQEHLLVALLQQEEGLIPKLIEKWKLTYSISPRMRSANWMRASKYLAATAMSMSEKI